MDPQSDPGLSVQELIYAGLDALRSVKDLDLCAYLHVTSKEGPQLFLSTPDLASIDPTEAFNLFAALRDTLEHEHEGDETVLLGQYWAVAVTSEGDSSKGLHVFGRRDHAIENGDREVLARLARSLGRVIHHLEAVVPGSRAPQAVPAGGTSSPIRVAVESIEDAAHAEVTVSIGDEMRSGAARDATPLRAVAAAVIEAIDSSLKLIEATDGDVAGERAVLVLLGDQQGRSGLGAALVGTESDPLRAAAVAALQGVDRLREPRSQRAPGRHRPPAKGESTDLFPG